MERQAALSICQRRAVLKLTMAEVPIDWIDHRRVISQLKGENTANANCRYAIYVSGWHNALSLLIKMVAAKTFFRHRGSIDSPGPATITQYVKTVAAKTCLR